MSNGVYLGILDYGLNVFSVRLVRLIQFLLPFFWKNPWLQLGRRTLFLEVERSSPFWKILVYPMEFFMLLLDILFIPDFLLLLKGLIKRRIRNLSTEERDLLNYWFGNQLINNNRLKFLLNRVVIHPDSKTYAKRHELAYVSFQMINYWKSIKPDVLVHEMVHILQYDKMGSIYILRALLAQRSREGYDYGDPRRIYELFKIGDNPLNKMNLEQMAEWTQDLYLVKNGAKPQRYSMIWDSFSEYELEILVVKMQEFFA
jgi:hypothetical protein